jgi:PAS domain S-box-containing protein
VIETACLVHGYTRDEYLGLSVADVAPTADPSAWGRNLEQLRRLGSRLHVGLHRRKDGSTFPVEVSITYDRMSRDYIVAVVRDITDRKRAEDALRRSEERLRPANAQAAPARPVPTIRIATRPAATGTPLGRGGRRCFRPASRRKAQG